MILPPIPTPFDREGRLDEEAFRELAQALEPLVDGLLVYGSNGEGVHLTPEERARGLRALRPRKPFLVGLMEETLPQAEGALLEAKAAGAMALLATPPRYYHGSLGAGLLRYYEALAEKMPLFLYHVPQNTKVDLPLEAVEALEMLYRMVQKGHAQARNLAEAQFAVADFLRTKAFMGIGPTTALPVVLAQTALPFQVGYAPLPRVPGGAVPLSGAVLVVLKGAGPEEARGAVAFWRHFLEPKRQADWVRTTWYLPLRRAAEAELKDFLQEPERRAVFAQVEAARPWSQDPELVVWYGYLEDRKSTRLNSSHRL